MSDSQSPHQPQSLSHQQQTAAAPVPVASRFDFDELSRELDEATADDCGCLSTTDARPCAHSLAALMGHPAQPQPPPLGGEAAAGAAVQQQMQQPPPPTPPPAAISHHHQHHQQSPGNVVISTQPQQEQQQQEQQEQPQHQPEQPQHQPEQPQHQPEQLQPQQQHAQSQQPTSAPSPPSPITTEESTSIAEPEPAKMQTNALPQPRRVGPGKQKSNPSSSSNNNNNPTPSTASTVPPVIEVSATGANLPAVSIVAPAAVAAAAASAATPSAPAPKITPKPTGKEKTPMCLVNELARHNKIDHQYHLTSEAGPPHRKRFTVTLMLGDEQYTADSASIKKAQHAAAAAAIVATAYKHPPVKVSRYQQAVASGAGGASGGAGANLTPTVVLNALAMKRGESAVYTVEAPAFVQMTAAAAENAAIHAAQPTAGGMVVPMLAAGPPGAAAFMHAPPPPMPYFGGRQPLAMPPPPPQFAHPMMRPWGMAPMDPRFQTGAPHRRQIAPGHRPAHYGRIDHNNARNNHHYHHHHHHHHGAGGYGANGGGGSGGGGGGGGGGGHNNQQPTATEDDPYRVQLTVGERTFEGSGLTVQAARHDAASKAIEVLSPITMMEMAAEAAAAACAADAEDPNADIKSPISLIHEIALKRSLTVEFKILSEKGPPHMKTFVTQCKVGSIITEGEGNGKKISKKKAAERMLKELRQLPPLSPVVVAELAAGAERRKDGSGGGSNHNTSDSNTDLLSAAAKARAAAKRKPAATKKRTRNLIKADAAEPEEVNPISRLIQVSQAHRFKEPHYELIETAGTPRRREFVIEVSTVNAKARGVGTTKKKARRQAAENLLSLLETVSKEAELSANMAKRNPEASTASSAAVVPAATVTRPTDDTETVIVLPTQQLKELGRLAGFEVTYSHFPKGLHSNFLTLVTLSTEPPQIIHGGGDSPEAAREAAAVESMLALSKLGLYNVLRKDANGNAATKVAKAEKTDAEAEQ